MVMDSHAGRTSAPVPRVDVNESEMDTLVRVASHMTLEEIIAEMRATAGFLRLQKWIVIYNAISIRGR